MPDSVIRLVEDDDSVAGAVEARLRSDGLKLRRYRHSEDFLAARDWTEPGCLVLDWHLPGITGGELQRRLVRLGVRMPIVAISGKAGPTLAARMVECGAVRFVEKPFRMDELVEAISIALGRDQRERSLDRRLDDLEAKLDLLSNREFETMLLMERGISSKVIAGDLEISERTVEQHRAAVFRKLALGSGAELARALALYRMQRAIRLQERAASIRGKRREKRGQR